MKKQRSLKKASSTLLAAFIILMGPITGTAWACGPCTNCATWSNQVNTQVNNHRNWFESTFWNGNMLPDLKKLTDRISGALLLEASMIGGFIDAQNHINSQLALQELKARAYKDYTPSESVCQFGTLTRSLAASQAVSRNVQMVLNERSLARQLGKPHMSSAAGSGDDRQARIQQFQRAFCDVQDNNNGMAKFCGSGGTDKMHNLDIDYTRLIDTRPTLDIKFDTPRSAASPDEEAVIALASNLFSHDIFRRYNSEDLKDPTSSQDNRTNYMNMRSLIAKRSVAENSFNAIVGMKAAGTAGSRAYIRQVLTNLGMQAGDVDRFMASTSGSGNNSGSSINPSYEAQMEILGKKIYQDPAFYANLMDKPANVERQYAAMLSFELMQKRRAFESILRSEMTLSTILEMEVAKYQDEIQNQLNTKIR